MGKILSTGGLNAESTGGRVDLRTRMQTLAKQIFFNGGFHQETDKRLSIQDGSLCFADGLFEVITRSWS
jgi:hypothetical protein